MERGGGVVHGHDQPPAHLARAPVDAGDGLVGEEAGHGVAPQRDHQQGIDEPQLRAEVVAAGLDFAGQGVAVARRAALEHVADVDLGAAQPGLGQQLLEEGAGLPHEGTALAVLVHARGLADEHDLGVERPLAGHGHAARLGEGAAAAGAHLGVQGVHLAFGFGRDRHAGASSRGLYSSLAKSTPTK